MAESSGRRLQIYRTTDGSNYTLLASVTSKSVAINNEPIDITTDDDDGWRTLLAEPGTRSIDISVSGVLNDEILLDDMLRATSSVAHQQLRVNFHDGNTLAANFAMPTFSQTGEVNGAVTFEAEFQSSGAPTYTDN